MGRLHDALKDAGFDGHALEVLLVRLLFCLFADDTGIFPRHAFSELVAQRTSADGADLGPWLAQLFQTLNTPSEKRQSTLDAQLAEFPYVNGKLFGEPLPLANFNTAMRQQLLEAAALDWSRISPAIFGSMFQSVMDAKARRNLGAHYTSETNILKLIGPLFLDGLKAELAKIGTHEARLREFHNKLGTLRLLDPACGCGNFLVIAYRELRLIELEVLKRLYATQGSVFTRVGEHVLVDVDQFYGIEIEEFPAQIAQVALWLMDHQMNLQVAELFGEYFARLPLVKSPTIVHGNALRIDWNEVVPKEKLSYILGNPPFGGSKLMSEEQRADLLAVAGKLKGAGVLDFVCAWHLKATAYAAGTAIGIAFVSTNSICQGEQVGILWGELLARGWHIAFAHRTFRWNNEAKGVAAVHCIIVGMSRTPPHPRRLFDYETVGGEPQEIAATNINPYLVDAPDVLLPNRSKPLCDVPEIGIGNKPIDGGYYLFTDDEKEAFIAKEPGSAPWFRRWLGSDEFINGWQRWCLYLRDCPPSTLRSMPTVLERVEAVQSFRLNSTSEPTRKIAETPTRFHVENAPESPYLVVPKVSSERRLFVPIGFEQPSTLSSDLVFIVSEATPLHFGVVQSSMHMAWLRNVGGRLKSDYRYSAGIVYNNFPWPEPLDAKARAAIEAAAQAVLEARAAFPGSTLADLYDPLTMPPALVKAHQQLDRAVDAAYLAAEKAAGRKAPKLGSDAERVAFLFERYQALTSLLPAVKPTKPRAKRGSTT
ncbi:MAG: class I SAM-dependent DNA methyltransferase [Xanthomonadaceae bacterium]|nr:class I SAM-dependent DNA methyltransferase [Silanimonas sp.]MBS3924186.1 class I SAM-dependent DNA methyltransferase [Xanthomonadaceae bacterium]